MDVFKLNEHTEVRCSCGSSRTGFAHNAYVYHKGNKVCEARINYYNRTWESYTFQSVLSKVLEKSELYTDEEIKKIVAYPGPKVSVDGYQI